MKRNELNALVTEAVAKSEVAFINKFELGEIQNLSAEIVDHIADKLSVEVFYKVTGSIDESPEVSIFGVDSAFVRVPQPDGFRKINEGEAINDYHNAYYEWYYNSADSSNDGFDFADDFGTTTIPLIEDDPEPEIAEEEMSYHVYGYLTRAEMEANFKKDIVGNHTWYLGEVINREHAMKLAKQGKYSDTEFYMTKIKAVDGSVVEYYKDWCLQ